MFEVIGESSHRYLYCGLFVLAALSLLPWTYVLAEMLGPAALIGLGLMAVLLLGGYGYLEAMARFTWLICHWFSAYYCTVRHHDSRSYARGRRTTFFRSVSDFWLAAAAEFHMLCGRLTPFRYAILRRRRLIR